MQDDLNPPNHNMAYPPASKVNRFVAMLLDTLLITLFSGFIFLLSFMDHVRSTTVIFVGSVILYSLILLVLWYSLFKDGLRQGQSIGKSVMCIMVINLDHHKPCGLVKSFLRNFLKFIPLASLIMLLECLGLISEGDNLRNFTHVMPYAGGFIFLFNCILVLVREDGKTLGDMIAHTQVIDKNQFVNN